jgi:hypothetical protein
MAEKIARDSSHPFDPLDPVTGAQQYAEYEGFAADVPKTDAMMAYARGGATDPGTTPANGARARRMFSDPFLARLAALPPTTPLGDGTPFPTPDRVSPTAVFFRRGLHPANGLNVFNTDGTLAFTVDTWSFRDEATKVPAWPAAPIRVREGQIVHTELNSATGPHVIHHHGIEPSPINDGVGHLTMDIGAGPYVYQWLAGESGTYFYHCHVNTVLHFERGMYGPLIIDPNVPGAPFTLGGPGAVHVGNNVVPYGGEALWVVDDFDTRWHGLPNALAPGLPIIDHVASGVQATRDPLAAATDTSEFVRYDDLDNNPRLNDFRPNVFICTGVAARWNPATNMTQDGGLIEATPGTAITPVVRRGEKLLVRTLNASYAQTSWEFPTNIPGQVIAADGRTFGREPFGRYSSPFTLASIGHQFRLSVARRWNVLLDIPSNAALGSYEVKCTFRNWITDQPINSIRMKFVVAA